MLEQDTGRHPSLRSVGDTFLARGSLGHRGPGLTQDIQLSEAWGPQPRPGVKNSGQQRYIHYMLHFLPTFSLECDDVCEDLYIFIIVGTTE